MLVYEKKVQEDEKLVRHLFGTMGNIPSEDDAQLLYKEKDGDEITPVEGDLYFDDKHHGIIRKSDGKSVYVFIQDEELGEVNIIPGGEFKPEPTDVESIEITTMPTKLAYTEGQALDLAGMVVTATYVDGDVKEVTDFTTEPEDGVRLERDMTTVVVSYGGQTAEFEITIDEAVLSGLEWTKAPTKVDYIEGEVFDLAGGIVDGIYTTAEGEFVEKRNMSDSVIYTLMDSGNVITKEEPATVAVTLDDNRCVASLDGMEAEQTITVAAKELVSISFTTAPTKVEYISGEEISLEGAVVTAEYNNDTTADVTAECEFSPAEGEIALTSMVAITATFEEKTAEVAITVAEKEAETEEELTEALTEGGEVKLTSDIAIANTMAVTSNAVIDLDGHELVVADGVDARMFNIEEGGSLVINGVSENPNKKAKKSKKNSMGKISINSESKFLFFVKNNASLTVNNCELTNESGLSVIMTNGNNSGSNVTLNNCVVNGMNYLPAGGHYEFNDCTMKGKKSALYIKSGETIINGGHYEALESDGNWAHWGNGCIETGSAVIVESCTYPSGMPKLTVSGTPEFVPTAGGEDYKDYGLLTISWKADEAAEFPPIEVESSVPYRYGEVVAHVYKNGEPTDGWYKFTDENTEER